MTTYDALRYVPELYTKGEFNWYLVTFDEAHKLKSTESLTIKWARRIQSARRLLLTGTPLQNDIMELWSLLNFMMPQIFNDSDQFESWFKFGSEKTDKAGAAAASTEPQITEEGKFMVI